MLCSLNRHSKINNLEQHGPACSFHCVLLEHESLIKKEFNATILCIFTFWLKITEENFQQSNECIIFFEKLNNLRYKKFLLVHPSSCVGQTFSSSARPAHSSPPFAGGGFVQLLVLFLIPCRQYLGSVHAVQDEYADHPPFTAPNSTNASICKGQSCNIN